MLLQRKKKQDKAHSDESVSKTTQSPDPTLAPAWTGALSREPVSGLQRKKSSTADNAFIPIISPQLRQPEPTIQREDKKDDSGSFTFNFEALPPQLQLSLGHFMLQANTSSTELQFTQNMMKYKLGYSYGSDIYLGAQSGGSSTRFGVNPSSGQFSLGYNQGQARFGTSVNPFSGGFGLSFGYGAPLMPMPGRALSDTIHAGEAGGRGILGGVGSMSNPLSFYNQHQSNFKAVMDSVKALKPLTNTESRFGAGLSFTYNPETGALLHGGLQWIF